MVYSSRSGKISSAPFAQDLTQLHRDGRLIRVVKVQACGVSPELLAQLGQERAWVEYRTLIVTANLGEVRLKMQPRLSCRLRPIAATMHASVT